MAGLLEIADDEFSALREALKKYESEVPAKIAADPAGVDLDLLSLRASYSSSSALAALDKSIASIANAELRDGTSDTLERALNRLLYVGIRTVSELDSAALDNHELASQFAKVWLEGKSYQHLSVGIGTFYLAYVLMAARQDKGQFVQYLDAFNIGGAEARNKMADRALAAFSEIQQSLGGEGAA
ncbi:hypothetical protein C8R26_10724 [Nitrosomonas oligotropha]|uniref:Uncharacterized protein n=1 Tax=Nitrosomonas oligotropha TaxID=42354 RepID=A0A2T5I120_9PROT|nr:hypothetical protein [Nitrosomonas oligotropha]PTQ77537.1 hypothetical protein C8R26_10724 [Nitrosomonas oligotropha]